MGTALLSADKVREILAGDSAKENLFKEIEDQFKRKDGIQSTLMDEIRYHDLSWQEMIDFEKEVSLGYGQSSSRDDFEAHYFTEQFTANDGSHLGNKVSPIKFLENFDEDGHAINTLTKLFADHALKDNGVTEGLNALFDPTNTEDCLEMFGIDMFKRNDTGQLVFSELNARPTAATRAFNTAVALMPRQRLIIQKVKDILF